MDAISAVYLPAGEPFSPHRGGALATWTHEVYGRLAGKINSVVITNGDVSPYEFPPLEVCEANPLCDRISRAIRNRRLLGLLDGCKPYFRQSHARQAAIICRRLKAGV